MKKLLVIIFCLLFAGCSNTLDLDSEWRPLKKIVERPGSDNWLTTVGPLVIVSDLDQWLSKNPVGSVSFNSTLSHEQVHAIRQKDEGVTLFLYKYLTSRSYKWKEEQLGWFVGIKLKQRNGWRYTVDGLTSALNSYSPRLANESELRQWVTDVLAGRWNPDLSDLPEKYHYLAE